MNSVTELVILVGVGLQCLLVAYAILRGQHLKTGRVWLPVLLGSLVVATASYLLPPQASLVFELNNRTLSALLLIVHFALFAGIVAADISPQRWRHFLVGGMLWFAAVLASVLINPETRMGQANWLLNALEQPQPTEIITVLGFIALSLAILGLEFLVFYSTRLPEVSNRALFWVFNSVFFFSGFAMSVGGATPLIILGLIMLSSSVVATTYSQLFYRVFDIRNVLGLILRLMLLVTMTSAAIFGALVFIERMNMQDYTEQYVLAGILAVAIATLYTPTRELANYLITKLIVGRTTDPIEATKRYSHEVSRSTEINELVDISSRTLNSVLRVKQSGMLLVSETGDDFVELSVIKGGGLSIIDKDRQRLPTSSPIYKQVVEKHSPFSQFDIEFNPEYQETTDPERDFFRGLGMSAYAPILMDNALVGLLVAGAKLNDTPIYKRDLDLLVALANQTGVALRNTRLVADLKHLNHTMQALNRSLGEANQQMNKLDSVKTDFITIASHELRTPLAQVRGYTDIIDALNDQGMLDQDQTRGLVNNLRKATERMEELIAAMLDVSQLDVNAMDLRFAQTSPESVLRMAIEPLTDPIKQRKLTLSARGLRGLPTIEADMQRLVQAFRNVITNAIKFTPDGGRIDITASFVAAPDPTKSDYILITITDTGIGINAKDIELIFNKFYRAADPGLHSTGTYKFMGAGPGLGLTIARGVIEGHGGRIWAESPGYSIENTPGSSFFIQLPLVPPAHARRVLPFEEHNKLTPNNKLKTSEMRTVSPS